MSVVKEITINHITEELEMCSHYFTKFGWELNHEVGSLNFQVKMKCSIDEEIYILNFECDNYKEVPPLIDFIDPVSGIKGNIHAYPDDRKGSGPIFHPQGPCICLQCSRKAYSTLGGPHGDWQMASWVNLRPELSFLGDMLKKIWDHINDPTKYKGRMG